MQLINTTSRTNFTIAFISIFFTFIISIFFQYKSFQDEIEHVQRDFIDLKKQEVKTEVLKVHAQIEKKEKEINNQIKALVKKRVHLAHTIATSIYNDNKDVKSDEEIKYLIVTALKNISFSNKRAYFFINRNDGRAVLFNTKSKLHVNSNIWNLKDKTGKLFIQEQAKIALEKDEGFLKTYFVKPDLNDNVQYPKISYIKMFKPFNWHIGTGEYIDDITNEIKQTILEDIANIRYGLHGYIFVNRIDKKALVFNGEKLKEPRDYPNTQLFNLQMEKIKNGGNFFSYDFKKLNSQKEFEKISFVKGYDKWGWIIGSGLYIDEVQKHIQSRKKEVINNIIKQSVSLILVLILLLAIVYLISEQVSLKLRNNIDNLIDSFKKASKKNKKIDTQLLTYEEFEDLANSLNKTLKSRNKAIIKQQSYLEIINKHVITSSTDVKGNITNVSDAFCEISGYSKDELIGQSHNIVRHPDIPKIFYKQMWEKLEKGEIWRGEILNLAKNGQNYWVDTVIQPIYKKEKIIGYTAIRHDITDKKKVEYLSITDELTKLRNRRFFNETIEKEFFRAKREESLLNFIMLDIDYFKKYNDNYGHQAGDEALKKVAASLKNSLKRASDYAFRLGGEEFGILFISNDTTSAKNFANIILKTIENLNIPHEKSQVSKYITASIGLVTKNVANMSDYNELYKLADEALYEAKEKGRNQVIVKE
ncbi:cache domain-containing protein [Arcobacter sp. YIC-464]|uniref:cache domain-containing protein n=1 Tax=Arcobacter sp. YIC-464 TaxID=3376631 RepID=UPI003C16385D